MRKASYYQQDSKRHLFLQAFKSSQQRFFFAPKLRNQRNDNVSYQRLFQHIRRIIGPEVLSSTPFLKTEKMIELLEDSMTLRNVARLIEKSNSSSTRDALIQSACRFTNAASFLDIKHFFRVLSSKKIGISENLFAHITKRVYHLSPAITAVNAIQLLLYQTLTFVMPTSLLLLLFSRALPDLHVLNESELSRMLYVLTLPPLKFHPMSQEWFPIILHLLSSKKATWNHSFSSINEMVSIIARGISFCTEQKENYSMRSASSMINRSIESWQILLDRSPENSSLAEKGSNFKKTLRIRETVFFLSACSYIYQHGVDISAAKLKEISRQMVNAIVLSKIQADREKPAFEHHRFDPSLMFDLHVNIIQDSSLLSKFMLALSHYAQPFVLKQMRMLFLEHHRSLRLEVDDCESLVLHITSIAMRVLRSMNIVGDRSTHDEEYDFLWEIVYGAICRKTGLNVLFIASSCLWNEDLIRLDIHTPAEAFSHENDHASHMESTVAATLYMIVSSYSFEVSELGNPALLDMICSVVQYQKAQFLSYLNFSHDTARLPTTDFQELRSDQTKSEMEVLVHQIFAASQDLHTMLRMVSIAPVLLEDPRIEKKFFEILKGKVKNFPHGLTRKLCRFILSNTSVTVHRWSHQQIALIFDMLQFHYTNARGAKIEEVYDITQLIHYVFKMNFSPGKAANSEANNKLMTTLPIKIQNSMNMLCFILCGHLCAILQARTFNGNFGEQATMHLWHHVLRVFQDTRVKLPKHMRNYLSSIENMIE